MKTKIIKNIIGPLEVNLSLIDINLSSLIVDGGKNHKLNLKKSFTIGDSDSSNSPCDIQLSKEKDASDLHFALNELDANEDIIECYGLFGGRLDHQMMLIGDISNYIEDRNTVFNIYSKLKLEITIYPKGVHQIKRYGLFSLLSFKEQEISLFGNIKYKLGVISPKTLIPVSSQGLSNEGFGEFSLNCASPIVVFYPDNDNNPQ
jgi:thiamine pyrophosphokinase